MRVLPVIRSSVRPTSAWPGARRDRGFALLITVTLLAFIVVLLLGLAVFTRIETSVAGNTQRQAQARENALLGLNVALAQLQKYAGPDTRVTATAESYAPAPAAEGQPMTTVNPQKTRYVGVWDSTTTDREPLAWLASGIESGAPVDITQPVPATRLMLLTGPTTDGSTLINSTVAALQDVTATGVPGMPATASTTIGRYAWWVADQGVKAPVAVPDGSSAVAYAPYNSAELRSRIRQQVALGAGAANAGGDPVFEPRDSNNSALVANQKVTATNQLAFLRTAANAQVGLTTVRNNFHAWSPNNQAVLANTKVGGLRQDLSLRPELLGNAFAAWANYTAYMEDPAASAPAAGESTGFVPPAISPAYGNDPLRRRYRMQPPINDGGVQHSVAPVLSYFLLSFNVRTKDGTQSNAPLEVRARWMFSLWNPYSSALVPEKLRLDISGLPPFVRLIDDSSGAAIGSVSLPSAYGNPLKIQLPWDAASSTAADRQSWLPGRVYTWTALADSDTSVPADGFASRYYSRTLLSSDTGSGVSRTVGSATFDGNASVALSVLNSSRLTARLYAVRGTEEVLLARFTSPRFNPFVTTPQSLHQGTYQFSYLFRLAEGLDTPTAPETWLLGSGRDPRRYPLWSSAFVAVPNGPSPELYPGYSTISAPERLLDRGEGELSYNEDVPVFELPRGPILSVGALQHLARPNFRSFGIGNSWSVNTTVNSIPALELFDRYFFSGLATGVTPSTLGGTVLLPNPLLKPLRHPQTATPVSESDLRAAPEARSSKHLLQSGAFNVNSTSAAAWAAVLRSVRFPAPQAFTYLAAAADSGTAADTNTTTLQSGEAQFLRFSQSAQETYAADAIGGVARTDLYRRGMRTLRATEVATLADRIVGLIKARHAALGPFRSLEEFVGPLPDSIVEDEPVVAEGEEPPETPDEPTPAPTLSQSLLERAIFNAGINAVIPEFSSQWLTQADILTALAPVLFPRSDTFVIRTYGEAVNPATSAVEGRAWAEATVQRVPDYFDAAADDAAVAPADLTSELNRLYGRRFKVISFRWLTRSDI